MRNDRVDGTTRVPQFIWLLPLSPERAQMLNCQLSVCHRTVQMTKAQVAELMEEVAGQEREVR